MSSVLNGLSCLGAIRRGRPPERKLLDGGEWKVAVGDTLRLYETALGAPGCEMSLAVAMMVGVVRPGFEGEQLEEAREAVRTV